MWRDNGRGAAAGSEREVVDDTVDIGEPVMPSGRNA
jgi:hypothetical protein